MELNLMQSKSNIPFVGKLNNLQRKQSEIGNAIDSIIGRIKTVQRDVTAKLAQINEIKQEFKSACEAIENGSFEKAIMLVGQTIYNNILTQQMKTNKTIL